MKDFNKEEYNKLCAEFLGWELHLAKTTLNWQDGTFMDWDDEEEFWIENPTEEFKQFRIVCHPEEVGLGYDFKLFESYHYKSGLKFHSDWNWIMEVVEKIETLIDGFVLFRIEDEGCFVAAMGVQNYNNYTTMATKKEAVIQAIWDFLNWHKENKA